MAQSTSQVIEAGPWRAIGLQRVGKPSSEIPALWEKHLLPRAGEIAKPERGVAFGVCRCVEGKTDGTFEYIAAFEATPAAAVPAGMMALKIPRSHYLVIPVQSLAEVMDAWQRVPSNVAALAGWEAYCGPKGCDCAQFPCFEFYPEDFHKSGSLYLYVPVKKAKG